MSRTFIFLIGFVYSVLQSGFLFLLFNLILLMMSLSAFLFYLEIAYCGFVCVCFSTQVNGLWAQERTIYWMHGEHRMEPAYFRLGQQITTFIIQYINIEMLHFCLCSCFFSLPNCVFPCTALHQYNEWLQTIKVSWCCPQKKHSLLCVHSFTDT